MIDFLLNGKGSSPVANLLLQNGFDAGCLRPYVGNDGNTYVTKEDSDKPVFVANGPQATLRVREWIKLDEAVTKVAKPRLQAVQDLVSAGLTYDLPNGMGHTVLQYQTMSDISPATISMDGLRESERDRPVYDLRSLPLPIIHKDFSFSARELMVSRNGGQPLDTTTAQLAARRVAEEAEKLTIGVNPLYQYGGGTIYGYKNFPNRITYTLQPPDGVGWDPSKTVNDVLGMIEAARLRNHYGPFILYTSGAWGQYLDRDYSNAKGDNTLRTRVQQIEKISAIKSLDYLSGWDLILVEMVPDVVQMVRGMDVTTVQWQEAGGMELRFKVMCIYVPRLRSDSNNNTGIVHAA